MILKIFMMSPILRILKTKVSLAFALDKGIETEDQTKVNINRLKVVFKYQQGGFVVS
jgi:hypothetical protein